LRFAIVQISEYRNFQRIEICHVRISEYQNFQKLESDHSSNFRLSKSSRPSMKRDILLEICRFKFQGIEIFKPKNDRGSDFRLSQASRPSIKRDILQTLQAWGVLGHLKAGYPLGCLPIGQISLVIPKFLKQTFDRTCDHGSIYCMTNPKSDFVEFCIWKYGHILLEFVSAFIKRRKFSFS
jgi:hypothetical protein